MVDFVVRRVLRMAIAFPLPRLGKSLRILNLWAGGMQCKPPATEVAPFFPNCINAPVLLGLVNSDSGYSATRFQRDTFPERYRSKIEVLFDGIDTHLYRPREQARAPRGRYRLGKARRETVGDQDGLGEGHSLGGGPSAGAGPLRGHDQQVEGARGEPDREDAVRGSSQVLRGHTRVRRPAGRLLEQRPRLRQVLLGLRADGR